MRDGVEQTFAEHPRPKLTYPFEHGPKTGEAIDVAPGLKWLRMPLGGALAFINVWAIDDGDGWAIHAIAHVLETESRQTEGSRSSRLRARPGAGLTRLPSTTAGILRST